MRIDHVIYATQDLERAAARVEDELGITTLPGGRHEGLGTHNRIVPLGGGYLELLAVRDPNEASSSVLGAALQARIEQHGEGLMAWAVAVDDVAPVAARLQTSITTIARQGLSARLTGLDESLRRPFLPFFLSRDFGIADPGAQGNAGGIAWIEVAGDRALLERWLDGAELPVRVAEGAPAVRAVGIGGRRFSGPP
jgi:hypothetical protein